MKLKHKDQTINIEIKNDGNFYEMIATDEKTGEKIGFVNFSIKYQMYGRQVWLQKIYVEEKMQNSGYGKTLLYAFEKFCIDQRATYIEGKYYPENETAVHFYNHNGYVVEVDGYDKLITKSLNKEKVEENYKKIEVAEVATAHAETEDCMEL